MDKPPLQPPGEPPGEAPGEAPDLHQTQTRVLCWSDSSRPLGGREPPGPSQHGNHLSSPFLLLILLLLFFLRLPSSTKQAQQAGTPVPDYAPTRPGSERIKENKAEELALPRQAADETAAPLFSCGNTDAEIPSESCDTCRNTAAVCVLLRRRRRRGERGGAAANS